MDSSPFTGPEQPVIYRHNPDDPFACDRCDNEGELYVAVMSFYGGYPGTYKIRRCDDCAKRLPERWAKVSDVRTER